MTTEQRTVDAAARVLYEELRGATSTKGLGSLLGAPPWEYLPELEREHTRRLVRIVLNARDKFMAALAGPN